MNAAEFSKAVLRAKDADKDPRINIKLQQNHCRLKPEPNRSTFVWKKTRSFGCGSYHHTSINLNLSQNPGT